MRASPPYPTSGVSQALLPDRGTTACPLVRHRALSLQSDQSTITQRLQDPDRWLTDTRLQPPEWTSHRDTLWFLLAVPSSRIPGKSEYISLGGSNSVPVLVSDTVGSALPEFCLVLPTGEVLEFAQYGDNIPLPSVVPQDEWAAINAVFTVQFDEHGAKRARV